MCGIFGIVIGESFQLPANELKDVINRLFKLSESRGKEASGLAVRVKQSIYVLKEPVSSSKLIKSGKYQNLFKTIIKNEGYNGAYPQTPVLILGHSRLQTNGSSEINSNNQPVVKDGAVGIHNGIIVNDEELWKSFPVIKKQYDVDTEVFLGLLQMFRSEGQSIVEAVRSVFGHIEGSASVAVNFDDSNTLVLATNTGSLYMCFSKNEKMLVFASEKYILEQILSHKRFRNHFESNEIIQVKADEGCFIDLDLTKKSMFSLKDIAKVNSNLDTATVGRMKIVELYDPVTSVSSDANLCLLEEDTKQSMMHTWEALYSDENVLKRCTRCLLPETMPFISFNEDGVCSYCRDYERRGS